MIQLHTIRPTKSTYHIAVWNHEALEGFNFYHLDLIEHLHGQMLQFLAS